MGSIEAKTNRIRKHELYPELLKIYCVGACRQRKSKIVAQMLAEHPDIKDIDIRNALRTSGKRGRPQHPRCPKCGIDRKLVARLVAVLERITSRTTDPNAALWADFALAQAKELGAVDFVRK